MTLKLKSGLPRFELRNLAGGKSVELWIYDDIGPEWAGMIGAKTIVDALKPHDDAETIFVRINSQGGSMIEAAAIYNILTRHKARKEVDIDGAALSAASFVAMAGDVIRMADNALFMVHDPWSIGIGTADDMRLLADVLDKSKANFVRTYSARTGLEESKVAQMMTDETWFDAAEAEEAGFVDSVTASKQIAAHLDLDRFKNAPRDLAARFTGTAASSIPPKEIEPPRPLNLRSPAPDPRDYQPAGMSDAEKAAAHRRELLASTGLGRMMLEEEDAKAQADAAVEGETPAVEASDETAGSISAARRHELLGMSELGRRTLAAQTTKSGE